MNFYLKRIGLAITLCCASSFAWAQYDVPREVQDLLHVRASSGEAALENMGYQLINTEKGSDRIWTNWWKRSSQTCLTVVTMNGRYDAISAGPEFDCQRHQSGNSGSSGGSNDQDHWRKELIGARGSSGEQEMEAHGYYVVDTYKDRNGSYTWWTREGGSKHKCMKMTVTDGRVHKLEATPGYPACDN